MLKEVERLQVKINSVGDAWRDWGIITAYKMLKNSREIQKYLGAEPELAENMLIISFKDDLDIEGLKDVTQEYVKENLLNKIVLRDFSMKVLGYPRERDKSGFYNARYAIPLEKEEISKVNETAGQRPLNNKAGVTLRRNYVGITPDWEKAVKELPDLVGHFYDQLQTSLSAKEATFCPVCGLAYNKKNGVKMRQNKNPFFNQHHNNKVRGHANTVDIMSMCPVCNFLNSLAAFSANLPYFIGDTTNLLLPEISNLHVLDKVYSKFDELLDMESPTLYSYITNIPELTQRSLYPSIITLYFAIKNKYSAKIDQFIEDINWDQSDEPYLHRWHVIRYNKGQNVIFNVFSTVDVHHRLFQLVDDIYYGKENAKKGNLVQRFLPNWRSSDKRSINVLAQGIVSKDWHLVAQSLYEYCREESKLNFNSISFFEKFIMKAKGGRC